MSTKLVLTVLFFLLVSGCVSTKQIQGDEIQAIEQNILQEFKEGKGTSAAIPDMVFSIVENATPVTLLVSSNSILKRDREEGLEDAAFLYYIGKFRASNDLKSFPSELTGGEAPGVAITALIYPIRQYIAKNLVLHPEKYARVVQRLSSWEGKYTDDYNPGWDTTEKPSSTDLEKNLREIKDKKLVKMIDIAKLLENNEYASLLNKLQGKPTADERDVILQGMRNIETNSGLRGFVYWTSQ